MSCVPPKLVAAGLDVRSRSDLQLAIRRLVHSDIVNNVVPRGGALVGTSGSAGGMQAALRMPGVFTEEENSKIGEFVKTRSGSWHFRNR